MMFPDTCAEALKELFIVGWSLLVPVLFYLIMGLLMFGSGGLNLFTDLLLIILPFPILPGLKLKWQK
jgi:peptidoglycan/LPS O-acetylase OafA/YrhL